MATTSVLGNNYKYELMKGSIDYTTDTFKIILMNTAYTFNQDTADNYSDVSGSELATAYGYTAGGITLSGGTLTRSDANDRVDRTWNNVTWNISGGSISTRSFIIYKDTGTPSTSTVIGNGRFSADQVIGDGGNITLANLLVRTS